MRAFATPAIIRELAKQVLLLDKDNQKNQKAKWKMLVKILNRFLSHERNYSEFHTKSPK